jgi:hypothetical protein
MKNLYFSNSKSILKGFVLYLVLFLGVVSQTVYTQCTHSIYLTDTWGDGWNGGKVSVSVGGATVLSNIGFNSGYGPAIFNFTASSGQTIRVWRSVNGSYASEMRVQIRNSVGSILLNTVQPTGGSPTSGGHTCSGSCPLAIPTCAGGPNSPANGAAGVSTSTTLSWPAVNGATGYDVYFGTGNPANTLVSSNQGGTTYSPASLNFSTTYFWRVVPRNSSGAASNCSSWYFTTIAPSPTISVGALSSFNSTCINQTSAANSFAVTGVYLTGNITINALSGFTYSTSAGGAYTSTLTLSPSSGNINTTVYVKFSPIAAQSYSGNIVLSGGGASSVNVAATATGLGIPTNVDAGADVTVCPGTSVNLSGNATGVVGTVNSAAQTVTGTAVVSGYDNSNFNASYTFAGLPAGAVITGISITGSIGAYCPSWYSFTRYINNVAQGASGCNGTTSYANFNGQAANGLVVRIQAQDNDAWSDYTTLNLSVTLTYTYPVASSALTYGWTSNPAGFNSAAQNVAVSPGATTTYTLTATALNGCTASDNMLITIYCVTPSITLGGISAFPTTCVNSTSSPNSFTVSGLNLTGNLTVNAFAGYTYSTSAGGAYTATLSLSPSAGAVNQTVYVKFTPTAAQAFNGNITVSGGGASTQNLAVTGLGLAIPTNIDAGADQAICLNANANLNVSGTGVATSTTIGPVSVTGTAVVNGYDNTNFNASYTFAGLPAGAVITGISITGSIGAYCPSWYSFTRYINNVAQGASGCNGTTSYANFNGQAANGLVVRIQAQDNDAWSDYTTLNLSVTLTYQYTTTSSAMTYSWTSNPAGFTSNLQAPTVSPAQNTSYTVVATALNGCAASDQVAITVNAAPVVTISANTNSVCAGNSATLNASGASTYVWAQGGTAASTQVSPNATTTYTVTGTSAGGCTGTAQSTISVNAAPVVTISANTNSVCAGNSATLNASGASTYVWAQGGTAASTQVSPNATTTYTVTGTSAAGCTGSAQSTISVNAAPVVTISANTNTVCAGNTATLNASGASTYVWAQGGTAASTQVSPNATTTYTVTGTSAGGCTGTAQSTISVNAAPVANAGPSINSAVTCGKNIIQLAAPALANGFDGVWTSTPIAVATVSGVAIPPNVNVTDFQGVYGGSYLLTWTVTQASTGCVGLDTMVVTFHQPNAASLGGMIGSQDVLWNGLSSSDWSTSNNWYMKQAAGHYVRMTSGQPASNTEVFTISNAVGGMCIGNNMPTLSVTSNAEDVYVNTGMSLNLTNDIINLVGNLTNHGTINASTGTINFTGGLSSTISGSGTTSLNNLTVNKSGGQALTVSMPVTVTGVLDMTLGNIFTSTNSILTLGNSSAVPGTLSWTSGNIVGPFRRYFINGATTGNAGLFPVGTAAYNRYAQVNFSSTPGVDQYLTVWYKLGAPLTPANIPLYNGLPLTTQDNQLVQNYSADGYWNVDPTASNYTSSITSAPYSMTLYANNLNGMVTPMITRMIKASGSNSAQNHHVQWQGAGVHTPIAGGTSPVAFAITSTNMQGFSWFNIGTSNNQALPVELLSFSGTCASEQVDLTWQTASEHNSLSFELEKSRDGEVWSVINTQAAAGNSTQLLTYTYSDKSALEGNNYYRLSQYDIDGASKVYDVINVNCSGSSKGYFSTYPNPTTGAFQVVLNNKELVGTSVLNIMDTKGSSILHRAVDVKAGINLFSVQDLQLAPGIYYISITNGDKTTEVIKQSIR